MARTKGSRNRTKRTPEQQAEINRKRAESRAANRKASGKSAASGKNGRSGASVNGEHPPGPNAQSLTDDQARALHYLHVKEYEAANAAVKEASGARKTAIGRIKAEGGDIEQIKATLEMQSPEGEARIREYISRTVTAARWSGSSIGNLQLEMFDKPDRSPVLEVAYQEGKTAGLMGEAAKTDFHGDAEQEFLRGWHDGQQALAATLDLFRSDKKPVEGEAGAAITEGEIQVADANVRAKIDSVGDDQVAPWLRDESESLPSNENQPEPGENLANVTDADFDEPTPQSYGTYEDQPA